jgi:uncharacterized protein (DUF1778 family)
VYTSQAPIRTARIEARSARDALAIAKRAAEIQGRSVSDFVVAAAQKAAERTGENRNHPSFGRRSTRIANPPRPAAGLRKATKAHRRLIREVR